MENETPKFSAKPTSKGPIITAVVVLVVIIALFVGITIFLFANPETTAVLRDISLILLALGTLIIALLGMVLVVALVYLTLKLNDLIEFLQFRIAPLLEKANDTAALANDTVRTVHSRVTVVSDEAVKPVVNVLSTVSAAKAVVKTLFIRNPRTQK